LRASITLAAAILIAVTGAARAETLTARRVAVRSDPAHAAKRNAVEAVPLTPDQQRHLADRERLWRSHRDLLTRGHVNWSPRAMRRAGWRAPRPMHVARNGVDQIVTPPDTLRVAFIRIDFLADRGGSASTGDGQFDLSGPDPNVPPFDRPPRNRAFYQSHAEALKRYHEAQNYGRTIIVPEVWPRTQNGAYHLSDMADYGPWTFGQDIYGAAVHMFRDMFFAADTQSAQAGDRIPWDQYDRFVLIHAGSDLQSDVRQDSKEDVPSFTIGVADTDVVWIHNVGAPGDSFPIDRCTFVPETETQDDFFSALNGVIAHECGHLFYGFFDVYDVSSGLPVVGYWSLMDSGNQVGSLVLMPDSTEIFATGLLPPAIDPYQRQFTGDALRPVEVSYTDTTAIADIERNPDLRKVRLSSDEYLLIENRYLYPSSAVELEQDSTTHVVLGPKTPDRLEYDALLPGGGLLVWHVDESVIPFESYFPLDTSLRVNPDFGVNSNPARRGLSVIEADGLHDLGDLSSPYILGSPFDPYYVSNNAVLSDTTHPNLIPNTPTRPHVQIQFLDDQALTMHLLAQRAWQLPGWPIAASFPEGGPQLLAVDADGDHIPEICWAGGNPQGPDSSSLFAVRVDGSGLFGSDPVFAQLDHPPLGPMAAIATGEFVGGGVPTDGPALFAVTTRAQGADTSSGGGRVWLVDHFGQPVPGWPAALPTLVTTPPVIAGVYPKAVVVVGGANGLLYTLGMDGTVLDATAALPAPIVGRLAVRGDPIGGPIVIAAGDSAGRVIAHTVCPYAACPVPLANTWQAEVGPHGWSPDFLWIALDGNAPGADAVCRGGGYDLVVHDGDRLHAFCSTGQEIGGWGGPLGDTLVTGLAAGDVDGDGYPDVIAQTLHSGLMYVTRTGRPAPGWPKRGTREDFRTTSPPLALDLDGSGRTDIVALNASGILDAFDAVGHVPPGWPLATGAGAAGAPLATDFNSDDFRFEIIAPDHLGHLYAYSLAAPGTSVIANPWMMLGGDAGRTSALPVDRTGSAPAASAGPLVGGSFKVYPNPARRSPVTFAYSLTEPARVQIEIIDTSGHRVASFTRDGHQSNNIDVWDPGRLPAGLYVARVSFKGSSSERTEVIPVGVLR
jgi:M6 family metalloprotease-like protein